MKKTIYLAALLFVPLLNLFSQVTGRGSISLSVGPALPVGDFAKKELDPTSGFAKAGQSASLSYAHLLEKRFGFTVSLHAVRNPIDTKAMEKSFSELKVFQGLYSSSTPIQPTQIPYATYPNWKIDKSSWLSAALLVGGYGVFPATQSERLAFTTKAMIGVMYIKSPELEAGSVTDTAIVHLEQGSRSAFGLAYLLSAGTKYNCTKKISLLVNLEFLGTSQIKFDDVKQTITIARMSTGTGGFFMQQTTGTQKQAIGSLNLNVGIGLAL